MDGVTSGAIQNKYIARSRVNMFIGVYWAERWESPDEVAGRIARFLGAIKAIDGELETWFLKSTNKLSASIRLQGEPGEIKSLLKVNRRDDNREPIGALGFEFSLWNGHAISLSVGIGKTTPHVLNSVVMSFEPITEIEVAACYEILRTAISVFEPKYGVVTNHEILDRAGANKPWEAGLFTYGPDGEIKVHSR